MTSYDRYSHPLSERYASREMQQIFSPKKRFGTAVSWTLCDNRVCISDKLFFLDPPFPFGVHPWTHCMLCF